MRNIFKYPLTILLLAIFNGGYSQKPLTDNHDTLSVVFNEKGELVITPSATSSSNDFDYLTGKWKLEHKKLRSRLTNCKEWSQFETTVECFGGLEGLGNFDICHAAFNGKPWEGRTVRLFDPKTRLWSLYWIDSNRGSMDPPVVGSFKNGIGLFFGKDMYNGRPVLVVFKWDKTDPNFPVWSQAFSDDNGKTWEWNWYNVSIRTK